MTYSLGKAIRYARAIQSYPDWQNPKALIRMRHMARDGATGQEISEAIGWGVTPACAAKRLKKYNIIVPFSRAKHAQRFRVTGNVPYLSPDMADISQVAYRPKDMGAAS